MDRLFKVFFVSFLISSIAQNQFCSKSSDFNFGQWIHGAANCGLLDRYSEKNAVTEFADWCWKPNNCKAVSFSAKGFCEVLKGKTILLVGDSLLHNMYIALFNELATEVNLSPLHDQLAFSKYPGRSSSLFCNGSVSILYMRSDHLEVKNENSNRFNSLWKIGLHEADILVINKGHHIVPAEVTEEKFEEQTLETIDFLKRHKLAERSTFETGKTSKNKSISYYFLETSPGHAFCLANDSKPYTGKLENLEQYNAIYKRYVDEKLSKFKNAERYGWGNYSKHDKFIEKMFVTELNGTVIPITHMTFLRPDGHAAAGRKDLDLIANPQGGDCLHYLSPSVLDNWVYVFYNLLLNDINLSSK